MNTLMAALEQYVPFNEAEAHEKRVFLSFLCQNPNALLRENEIGHVTTSAWVVNRERTKVLMIYHNIYDSWAWMGGHADGEDNLVQVARREVAEESGLEHIRPLWDGIYGINILPVASHMKRGSYVSAHLHFDVEYLFEADEAEPIRVKPDENSGVMWVPMDEIDTQVREMMMKPVYHLLNEKLNQITK